MGVRDWAKRQPQRATGFVRKVVGGDQIQSGADYIKDLGQGLKPRRQGRETFENAVGRLNLREEDLRDAYKFQTFRFFLFLGLSVAAGIGAGYFALQSSFAFLGFLGFICIGAAQIFNASFRMMQIRYKELLPVKFWLQNSSEWWYKPLPQRKSAPKQSSGKTISSSSVKRIKKG